MYRLWTTVPVAEKWAKVWDEVKYCSDGCRKSRDDKATNKSAKS